VAGCSLAFAAVVGVARHPAPRHVPAESIGRDLGTTPEPYAQVAALGLLPDLRQQ
jgi:hypothetical protein